MTVAEPINAVMLDADDIAAHLGHSHPWQIRVEASLASSNSTLMQELRQQQSQSFPNPVLIAVEEQTAGRGRQGRAWQSAPGASLTFSIAWPMRRTLAQLSGLSLSCGLAVRTALLQHGVNTQLKWPNDILFDQRKLAGILVEVQEIAQGAVVIIGIGLNVSAESYRHVDDAHLMATDLVSAGMLPPVNRNRLLADLAHALAEHLVRFEQYGFAIDAEAWNAAHAYQDRSVQLLDQGRLVEQGIARGVDRDGRLLLATHAGLQAIIAGDVSLRPVNHP